MRDPNQRPDLKLVDTAEHIPLLETRKLSFTNGSQSLIHGIDLALQPGKCTVIMGANGTGKSLLVRLMHGLLKPTAGEVLWQGKPLNRTARDAQALVFQHPVMLRRSVLANLRFALAARGIGGRERNRLAEKALEDARLTTFANRPARVLSGGEQQRLAIARALACSPELLFLDEPTASLDPASTALIEELVLNAHAQGVSIVMITHDKGQAQRIAEDIVFLHAGRIAERGPAASVLTNPQSPAAQAWLSGKLYLA